MKWRKYPDERPTEFSGSYLIITKHNDIAEAEYRTGYWYQYRWPSKLSDKDVVAWCKFSDIEKPNMQ